MIYETLKAGYLNARKEKISTFVKILSPLIADCEAVGKKNHREPTDAECIAVIKSFAKRCKLTLDVLTVDNPEHSNVCFEIQTYESYLPRQLSEEDLYDIVSDYIMEESGSNADFIGEVSFGQVMGYMKANYNGQYDGKLLSKVVKEFLEPKK